MRYLSSGNFVILSSTNLPTKNLTGTNRMILQKMPGLLNILAIMVLFFSAYTGVLAETGHDEKAMIEFVFDYCGSPVVVSVTANPSSYDATGSYTIPLKRAGNLILMDANVDGVAGNLILDTGSKSLVLNSIYFRDSRRTGNLQAGGITGIASGVSNTRVKDLHVSELSFRNLAANVTDLGHIEHVREIRLLGFFGLHMLNQFEVVVDLHNSMMELHRINNRGIKVTGNQEPDYDLYLPVRVESDIVFMEATIGGRKLVFCLDTGAESNVMGSHLPDRVLGTVSIYRRTTLKGAGSRSLEVLVGRMNEFQVEDIRFPEMNTIISNMHVLSKTYGLPVDGMLGSDFLESGVFYINLRQKRMGIVLHKDNDEVR